MLENLDGSNFDNTIRGKLLSSGVSIGTFVMADIIGEVPATVVETGLLVSDLYKKWTGSFPGDDDRSFTYDEGVEIKRKKDSAGTAPASYVVFDVYVKPGASVTLELNSDLRTRTSDNTGFYILMDPQYEIELSPPTTKDRFDASKHISLSSANPPNDSVNFSTGTKQAASASPRAQIYSTLTTDYVWADGYETRRGLNPIDEYNWQLEKATDVTEVDGGIDVVESEWYRVDNIDDKDFNFGRFDEYVRFDRDKLEDDAWYRFRLEVVEDDDPESDFVTSKPFTTADYHPVPHISLPAVDEEGDQTYEPYERLEFDVFAEYPEQYDGNSLSYSLYIEGTAVEKGEFTDLEGNFTERIQKTHAFSTNGSHTLELVLGDKWRTSATVDVFENDSAYDWSQQFPEDEDSAESWEDYGVTFENSKVHDEDWEGFGDGIPGSPTHVETWEEFGDGILGSPLHTETWEQFDVGFPTSPMHVEYWEQDASVLTVRTVQVAVDGGTVTPTGDLKLADNSEATVYFRYRELGRDDWTWYTGETRTENGPYTTDLDLSEGTTYEVQALAQSGDGKWKAGEIEVVSTGALAVKTAGAEVSGYNATLSGELLGVGSRESATVYFRYRAAGTDRWYWYTGASRSDPGTFSTSIRLVSEAEYEFQTLAKGSDGTWNAGDVQTFSTE